MAKLSASGGTVFEWANAKTGNSWAVRANGELLRDQGFGWKRYGTVKAGLSVADYIAHRRAEPTCLPNKRAPSWETLRKWSEDGIARATDGCKVEPDGHCPHGCQSWLLVRGVI